MKAVLLAGLAAITASAPVPQPINPALSQIPHPAVVVLWASWCVSCRAELARLPSLATAAAPLPIVTLAIDPPERAKRVLAERGMQSIAAFADGRDPRIVLNEWGGKGSALPIAVAIGPAGKICGRKLGLLGTNQLREWATRCSR